MCFNLTENVSIAKRFQEVVNENAEWSLRYNVALNWTTQARKQHVTVTWFSPTARAGLEEFSLVSFNALLSRNLNQQLTHKKKSSVNIIYPKTRANFQYKLRGYIESQKYLVNSTSWMTLVFELRFDLYDAKSDFFDFYNVWFCWANFLVHNRLECCRRPPVIWSDFVGKKCFQVV